MRRFGQVLARLFVERSQRRMRVARSATEVSLRAIRALSIRTGAMLLIVSSVPATMSAQEPAVPTVVAEGLDLLVAGRPADAVARWGRAWTGADTAQAATLLSSLEDLGELLGRVHGFDLVEAFEIGPNISRLYIVIRYDKQPLYAFFFVYRPRREWQVNAVRWNTDATAVFPASLTSPP
jgi:hypothetical protein